MSFDNIPSVKKKSGANIELFRSATAITGDGYIVEAAIPLQFITPREGLVIGFDLMINDDPGKGARVNAVAWANQFDIAYKSTEFLGEMVLQ